MTRCFRIPRMQRFFDDPRDAEVNAMMLAIPKDRNGVPPSPERIFGSLPVTDFSLITIPGLAADLDAVYARGRMARWSARPRGYGR